MDEEYKPKPPAPNGRYTPKKLPKEGAIRTDQSTGLQECFVNGKWETWNPEVPDFGHPSIKRRETEPPTYEQLRRAYHDRVIRVGSNRNHVRMVGHCELKDYDGNGESGKMIKLWFPDKDFEKNDGKLDYNLVFSLASDGRHYLVADRDSPVRGPSSNIWVPSSTNWHEYGTVPMDWGKVMDANNTNLGYLKQISRSGMAGVRPPWILKDEDVGLWPMNKYKDIEPWTYEAKELPESPELAWEQLWEDDDDDFM
jgi:hypothetical protein